MSSRTFKIDRPLMHGEDIKGFQITMKDLYQSWDINYPVKADGVWGFASRSACSTLLHAMGIGQEAMEDGVTPELRVKVRNRNLTAAEELRFKKRVDWRRELRDKWAAGDVAKPVNRIIEASWGFHPPQHDGLDVICKPNATLYAMVKSKVIRADAGGWWGKAPSGDVTRGDGIITLQVLENVGPFKKGLQIGYGHAEHPKVRVGQTVDAGDPIGVAGFAVAWHIHLMVEAPPIRRGRGDRDPRPYLNYVIKHG